MFYRCTLSDLSVMLINKDKIVTIHKSGSSIGVIFSVGPSMPPQEITCMSITNENFVDVFSANR